MPRTGASTEEEEQKQPVGARDDDGSTAGQAFDPSPVSASVASACWAACWTASCDGLGRRPLLGKEYCPVAEASGPIISLGTMDESAAPDEPPAKKMGDMSCWAGGTQ